MAQRGTFLGAVALAVLLSVSTAGQAGAWDFSALELAGPDLPFETSLANPSPGIDAAARGVSFPVPFGVKFTAWWNDLRTASPLDFRSDSTAPRPAAAAQSATGQRPAYGPFDWRSSLLGVNVLAERPFGTSSSLPNGRLSPYVGMGTGAQLAPLKVRILSETDARFSPALQVVAGVQLFISQSLSVFSEYKFTPSSPHFVFPGDEGLSQRENHLMGGMTLHF